MIEQNNSNTRHYLGRMTRRTKVVTKSEKMLKATLDLWVAIAESGGHKKLHEIFSSIFM
jgi:hypothetical protein